MKNKRTIYYAGDFVSNNGPSIVNQNYFPYINNVSFILINNNKFFRIIHFTINLVHIKTILVSSLSVFHLALIKIGNILGKPTFYLMHGYVKLESEINQDCDSEFKSKLESNILDSVGTIICVSENFSNFLKEKKPNLAKKITFVNNGVDDISTHSQLKNLDDQKINIVTVGGGMPLKNNLIICEAINTINNPKISLVVIGPKGRDGDRISQYPFVKYIDNLKHEEVLKLMQNSDLFIQNSYFETFGLAVCEAICRGCDVLLSRRIGAISIIDNLCSNSIIDNNDDINEIILKIKYKINYKSNVSINAASNSWHSSCSKLIRIVRGSDDSN